MLQDVLLGVGITLIIISLLLIGFSEDPTVEKEQLSEEEIINRAKNIGMIFPELEQEQQEEQEADAAVAKQNLVDQNKQNDNSSINSPKTIKIPPGISSQEVADILLKKKLIKDQESFMKLLKKFNLENKIRAGEYEVKSNISPLKLLLILTIE
ncbi:MAG: hypothetical protein ACQERJ_01330 [Bacillota bacterium]